MGASATATEAAAGGAAQTAPAEEAAAAAPPTEAPAAAAAAEAPAAPEPAAAAATEEGTAEAAPAPAGAVPVEPGLVTPGTKTEEGGKGAGWGKGGVRIHVRNLSAAATTAQLKELFAPYGDVVEAEAKTSEDGKCKGFGFVILPTAEEAAKAVAELNKKEVEGKELVVMLPEKKQKGVGKGEGKAGKGEGGKKGKKGEFKGEKGDKGKGKGKGGKGGGIAAPQPGMTPGGYPPAYNPYMYGMPPYGYPYPPYMYGMPPYGYPSPAHAAAAAAYSPAHAVHAAHAAAAYQAAAMQQMWQSPTATAMAAPGAPVDAAAAAKAVSVSPFFPPGGAPSTPAAKAPAAAPAEPAGKGKKGKGKGKGKGKDKGEGKAAATETKDQPKDAPPADKEFVGVLKSLSEKNGYGFIVCDQAKELYSRDVWVDSSLLPENARVSARLRFNMALSPKGHPQAQNVRAA